MALEPSSPWARRGAPQCPLAVYSGFSGPNQVQWADRELQPLPHAHPEDLSVELRHGVAVEHQHGRDDELCGQPRLQPYVPHQHQRRSSDQLSSSDISGCGTGSTVNCAVPYPIYQQINGNLYQAISNYNSLQTTITKRLQHGFSFTANYTWSHFLDDQDSSGWGTHAGPHPYQYAST